MLSRVHEFVQSLRVLPSRWTRNGFHCFTDGDTGKVKAPAGVGWPGSHPLSVTAAVEENK